MDLFGTTRSRVRRSHALIAPDSFVTSDLPGWERSQGIILISPRMGARFAQYLALMEPGGTAGPAPPGVERVLYVLEGQVALTLPGSSERSPRSRRVRLLPARRPRRGACDRGPRRLNVFEKRYVSSARYRRVPTRSAATSGTSRATPFLGDPDAILKVLLPRDPRFDLAVNVFTFRPGATLPWSRFT